MKISPRRLLPLLLSVLLAACAGAPHTRQAPATAAPSPGAPAPATSASTPAAAAVPATSPSGQSAAAPDVWQQLRDGFRMDGCDSDPDVLAWARRYTRSPAHFEAKMKQVLPRLVYVQQAAERYGVAGEFALLPWVESHFAPVPGHGRAPAGMWQIVPITARSLHLPRKPGYDARLDLPLATDAVMGLLGRYHERFGDWRLVDYAYNRGEFTVRRLIRHHGLPPPQPTIPQLPIRKATREHLTKLLAIACVVREPERFHVSLPTLPSDRRLVVIRVDRHLSMDTVARDTGMSVHRVRQLNAAFTKVADMPSPHLLLPRDCAERFLGKHPQPADENPGKVAGVGKPRSMTLPVPAANGRPLDTEPAVPGVADEP